MQHHEEARDVRCNLVVIKDVTDSTTSDAQKGRAGKARQETEGDVYACSTYAAVSIRIHVYRCEYRPM